MAFAPAGTPDARNVDDESHARRTLSALADFRREDFLTDVTILVRCERRFDVHSKCCPDRQSTLPRPSSSDRCSDSILPLNVCSTNAREHCFWDYHQRHRSWRFWTARRWDPRTFIHLSIFLNSVALWMIHCWQSALSTDYAYTSRINVTATNVQQILYAASILQVWLLCVFALERDAQFAADGHCV